MKLIFNADDFGYCKGANLGIIEAYQNGVVRSTSIMANKPGFYHAVGLAHLHPALKVGLHFTVTSGIKSGQSVGAGYRTLTDSEGYFYGYEEFERRLQAGELDLNEVAAEYEAQLAKLLAAGIRPDHFDGHQHIHNMPGIADIFLRLAKKHDVAVRFYERQLLVGEYAHLKIADTFADSFYDDDNDDECEVSLAQLQKILAAHQSGSLEVMCHPAYVDAALLNGSPYNLQRARELAILASPELKALVSEYGFTLCTFDDL
jgi:predicted glycoside hydrolase/deacetylase ChbG (UPF0249 family)